MKKTGLLLGIATVLTVGGVYATWSFADDTAINDESNAIAVGVAGSTSTLEAGKVSHTGAINLLVDQAAANDYHGKLVTDTGVEQSIVFTFEPNSYAEDGWKDGNVNYAWKISYTTAKYGTVDILVDGTGPKEGNDAVGYTCTITSTMITDAIKFNPAIEILNSNDHALLSGVIGDCSINVSVAVTKG
jgi:hypothetical protein